jgi:hypothetical protein
LAAFPDGNRGTAKRFAEVPKRFADATTGFGVSHKASARRRTASS